MIFTPGSPLRRCMAPQSGDGSELPGDADYGDEFTPTEGDAGEKQEQGDGAARRSEGAGRGEPAADAKNAEGGNEGEGESDSLRDGAPDPAEAEGEEEKKDTGTPKTAKGKFIPLDRHEKLLKKERARREEAEAQLQQSRAGQQVVEANQNLSQVEDELVAMEEKYNDLLAEGDTKGAAQLMTQIRRKNAELNAATAAQRDAEVMARAVEKVRYDEALDRIEDAYPVLDPDSEEYDEDTYQDVVDLMQAGQRRGLSPTKALQRAVQRVMGADTSAQKRATTVTPRVDEDEVGSRRKSDAVRRNLDAAERTPPATHRVGSGNSGGGALTAKAVLSMSESEFEKLSDADLARLRGDTL